ncbi:MAG: DUF2029 domain-containing protein [Chloroflexi bacterium]|nr:DUF2029 domain-containing protein [Chloroflexota bacterium]
MLRRLPFILFCVALIAFAAAFQSPRRVELAVGAEDAAPFLANFYDAERGYRWTQAHSTIWLSGLGGGNQAWHGAIRLSGSRPGASAGPSLTISLNGAPAVSAIAANAEREYAFDIAPGQLGVNGDARIDIESQTFTPTNDPRELGVRVFDLWLEPQGGFALPSLKLLLMALSLAGAFTIASAAATPSLPYAARRNRADAPPARGIGRRGGGFGRRSNLILQGDEIASSQTALLAMTERVLQLSGPFLWFATLVWAVVAVAVLADRAAAGWWLSLAWLAALALGLAAGLVGWIAPRAALGSHRWRFALLLFAAAALVRLVLGLGRGYEGDVEIYLSLAWKTVTYGIHSAYITLGEVPPPNTPPFLLYPFAVVGWLYRELFSPLFPPTWLNDPALLRFLMRWPTLLADLVAGALILRATFRADDRRWWLPVTLYLFNPALIFDSAYWGQTAAIHALWMLLAVMASARRWPGWAGAALSLALTTKPQALAIAPLPALNAWRDRGLLRFAAAGLLAWLVVVAPFLAAGMLGGVIAQYTQTAQYHPYLSVNAHNLWWLLTAGQGWQPDTNGLAGVPFRIWGFALFGLATLLSVAVTWRNRASLDLAAAYQSLAFFMLLSQIHENHALPLFAPLALACAGGRASWRLYGALALTALANMALHDPALVQAFGFPGEEIYGGPGLAAPRLINAAVQTALFGWMTIDMLSALRGARKPA